jgi:SAM-dependent methyltransferase
MSPSLHDYAVTARELLSGYRTTYERGIAEQRRRDVQPYLDLSQPLRVLDLGNGRLRPQYELLQEAGHQVFGIDLINRSGSGQTDRAYRVARWLYNRHIRSRGRSADRLVCGDVSRLPYLDNAFDLITSVAAFEHFLNVPAVVSELYRVLRSGGIAWIAIHLFTSLSGGHNIDFTGAALESVPPGVDPWDHLRQRKLPFTVPLNEWRRDEYLAEFARHFEIESDYCVTREAEALLTPGIQAELSRYDRDELTCKAYVLVARKVH